MSEVGADDRGHALADGHQLRRLSRSGEFALNRPRNARGVYILTATYLSGARTVTSGLGAGRVFGCLRNHCGQPWLRWLPLIPWRLSGLVARSWGACGSTVCGSAARDGLAHRATAHGSVPRDSAVGCGVWCGVCRLCFRIQLGSLVHIAGSLNV